MNIMFLFYKPIVPNEGGVQRVTYALTQELQKRGHNVIFVSNIDKEDINKYDFIAPQYHLELEGRHEQEIEKDIQSLIKQNKITHVVCQTLDKAYLFKYFTSDVKKVAVCHVQPFSFMGITRKRIWNTNTQNLRQILFKVVSLISPKIHERFFFKFEKRALEEAVEYADKICFISERFFPRIKKYLPTLPQDKFVAINNPNTYDASIIELPKDKENIILWVGRIENAQKNAVDFVRMWQKLSDSARDWRAIMVGDGSDLVYIKNYVKKNNIKRIEFTGKRNDTELFYEKAKYIVVTSFGESWCLVLTEAMSYGCVPVIYDTYETLHDIVEDKKNGFIIPTISHKLMTRCLLNNIQQKETFRSLSVAAQEKVKRFSIEKTVDSWDLLLRNI